jgi:hypothetical protein
MSISGPMPDGWNPDAASEEETEFDGVFSWAGESHAFAIGFGVGITGSTELMVALAGFTIAGEKAKFDMTDEPHMKHAVKEPAYALSGLALGYMMNLITLGEPAHESILGLLSATGVM